MPDEQVQFVLFTERNASPTRCAWVFSSRGFHAILARWRQHPRGRCAL